MKLYGTIQIALASMVLFNPVTAHSANPPPAFIQSFETDTSGWFPRNYANVSRVPSGDISSSYNIGTTSQYGDAPINAATGSYFGRVTSAVSSSGSPATGSCILEAVPGGDALLCAGPFTHFGIKPSPADSYPAHPFPPGGYTTEIDIYLDQDYAVRHQDCGLFGPCKLLPDPPDLNPACDTNPNGIDCEGTRFNWTVGLSRPDASFLQDYVFSVGTAPKHPSQFDPENFYYCLSGWIITAGYNSFRSGGDYYNPDKEPMCLSGSGWYTFKQVFKDVGGQLEVDYFVLDSSGAPAQCTNHLGVASPCQWTRAPGHAIADVGCPRYGWLANEEINDLPIDNTKLFASGCGFAPIGQIAPTDTSCRMYADGTAGTLEELTYTVVRNNPAKLNAVSPGAFFYYTRLEGDIGDVVHISQLHTGIAPDIAILKNDVKLYSSTCSKLKWESLTVNPDGTATGTLPEEGSFIIGVKYNPSSLKGKPVPNPEATTYTFSVNGFNPAAIDLVKRH